MEGENLLHKVCNILDEDGYLVEQYKTRVYTMPVGVVIPLSDGKISVAAPSLYRTFNYDDEGNQIASLPRMREWTQACEDVCQGADPNDPIDFPGVPAGLKVAKTRYEHDEQLAVPYNTETTVVSLTANVDEPIYLRKVSGSGDNKGTYHVYIDGVRKNTKRSWWTDFNVEFDFSSANGGIYVVAGSTVTIKVINDSNSAETFDGSIGYVIA